jgi:hypothetical protein
MEAIQTEYNGVLLRSRLEARWAILFDELNIKWVYEPDCFLLSNGQKYTPDFYIPKMDLYIEIKPNFDWIENDYHKKRYELFKKDLLILSGGFPNFDVNMLYHENDFGGVIERGECEVVFIPNHYKYGSFWFTGHDLGSSEDGWNEEYINELNKVKQHRFWK